MPSTPAEFSTLRRLSGLSRDEVADMLNVQVRTIKNWERPGSRVPDDAVAAVRASVGEVNELVAGFIYGAFKALPFASHAVGAFPRGLARCANIWDAAVARYVQGAPAMRVVHFDADSFAAFVEGRPLERVGALVGQLAAWAASQVEAQALPHSSDQPAS